MRKFLIAIGVAGILASWMNAGAEKLVILHTNDTHSQIDPTDDNLGGAQRRKVVIDSIRAEHKNVLLIDAGDAVQGTLFFTLYGGEVEMKMMNELGYDIAILGNHDFDNGVDALAKNLQQSKVQWVTTNYDLSESAIASFFRPYVIKEYAGKKVGVIGLNLNPKGMISEGNYDGVKYLDAIKAANATAWHLKHNEKVDLVVAVTHVGYDAMPPSDKAIVAASEDIDVLLGGHTHTLIVPGSGDEWVKNSVGKPVLVTQNGKGGLVIGEVEFDLDHVGDVPPTYKQIAINSRLDGRVDHSIDSMLNAYRDGVDDLMGQKIGRTAFEMSNTDASLLNLLSDFLLQRAKTLPGIDGKVDLAIMNKGSIRRGLPKGNITRGQIIMMQPFNNRVLVEEISGADLADALDIMAHRDGDGVSEGTEIVFDAKAMHCTEIMINGEPLDKEKTYRVATIDYLANGGDYMEPLTRGKVIAQSTQIVHRDLVEYIIKQFKGKKIKPSTAVRMCAAK